MYAVVRLNTWDEAKLAAADDDVAAPSQLLGTGEVIQGAELVARD